MVYVPLGVRTEYGFLDGMCRVEPLVERARDLRLPAVGIADLNATHGLVPFFIAARAAGVRPLLGVTVHVQPDIPARAPWDGGFAALQLLARNETGLRNLLRLTSRAHLEILPGVQGNAEPRVGFQDLEEFAAGVVALDGGLDGPVTRALAAHGEAGAISMAKWLRNRFGADGYFIRVQRGGASDPEVERGLVHLARTLNVPLVGICDVRYLEADDAEAYAVLRRLGGRSDGSAGGSAAPLRSDVEMRTLFRDLPEALDNTNVVAELCQVDMDLGRVQPFRGASASGRGALDELRRETERGATRLFGMCADDLPVAVRNRLTHELAVIEETELASGFLIVQDVVRRARSAGIPLGPGRGAAAGSLVCYTAGITEIDPLAHGLEFDRFLSRQRRGIPAFEFDVAHRHRDALVRDILRHFGPERAARAAHRPLFSTRGILRAVADGLEFERGTLDTLLEDLRTEGTGDVWQALDRSPRLRRAYQDEPRVRQLFEISRRLEGLPRNPTLQAGGLWIAPERLTDLVALQRTRFGDVVVQGADEGLRTLGLLRLELAASRAVTVVGDSVRLAAHHTGTFDLRDVPLDDPATLEAFGDGDTVGIPQFDGAVTQSALRAMRPTNFADLVTVLCLVRAGAREETALDRVWTLPDGASETLRVRVAPLLAQSRGLLLYPEQVLRVAVEIGGYSAEDAAVFLETLQRRRIGDLARQRSRFLGGALETGLELAEAEGVFDALLRFRNFDFDRAHATGMALVAYWSAYVRAQDRPAFTAALLNARSDRNEWLREIVADATAHGVPLWPADVNHSAWAHAVEGKGVRIGLGLVHGMTVPAAERLIRDREQNGVFRSVADLCRRVASLSDLALGSLAKAGALASAGLSVRQALEAVAQRAEQATRTTSPQLAFDFVPQPQHEAADAELPLAERIELEREALGVALHSDPLLHRSSTWTTLGMQRSVDLADEAPRAAVRAGGRVRRHRETRTRQGERMAFLEIEDPWGVFEVVVFPGPFSETRREVWDSDDADRLVVVNGRVEREGRATRVVAERIEIAGETPQRVVPIAAHAANRGAALSEADAAKTRARRGSATRRSGGVNAPGRQAS